MISFFWAAPAKLLTLGCFGKHNNKSNSKGNSVCTRGIWRGNHSNDVIITMSTYNLFSFKRCSLRQKRTPAAIKDVVDQIIAAVVCRLDRSNMRACFSARRLLRSRSFSPQQTKPSLYRTHSSESVPLDLLS